MVDVEQIKARVSLRSLLERDNVTVRRAGASLVACCPIHQETTPSFHLHEKTGGDWFKCFGCDAKGDIFAYWQATRGGDFKEALEALASIAGFSAPDSKYAPLPKREVVEEFVLEIKPLLGEDWLKWSKASELLHLDKDEVNRWAAWRGIRPQVIEWAAKNRLCGKVMMYGAWREAFLIQDVSVGVVRDIGWHVRLSPRTEGGKASWRYSNCWRIDLVCEPSRGLGAWPFVVLPEGGIAAAKYIFCCEGQWDALALIDVMGWDAKWPTGVALFGMRGATSWKKFMEYELRPDATAFLFADNDSAGRGWFVGEENFSDKLRKRVKAVYGYSPRAKDLNDEVRGMPEDARSVFRAFLRQRISKQKSVKLKPTFLRWLRNEKKKDRTDGVIEFAAVVTRKGAETPKGRPCKKVWVRYMEAWPEHKAAFYKAWAEWEAIK